MWSKDKGERMEKQEIEENGEETKGKGIYRKIIS